MTNKQSSFLPGVLFGRSFGMFCVTLLIIARKADNVRKLYEWRGDHGEDDKGRDGQIP